MIGGSSLQWGQLQPLRPNAKSLEDQNEQSKEAQIRGATTLP